MIYAGRPSTADVEEQLRRCGYAAEHLQRSIVSPSGAAVALMGFAHAPHDARSACIAVLDPAPNDISHVLGNLRTSGAPIVFVAFDAGWDVWKQTSGGAIHLVRLDSAHLHRFFTEQSARLAPGAVYRAKTWGRFDSSYQLEFVDLGLMPLIEEEIGTKLAALVERIVIETKSELRWKAVTPTQGHWLLQANFWLLAAKILRDKGVPSFQTLDLLDLQTVFKKVALHYGSVRPISVDSSQVFALSKAAKAVSDFASLDLVSTEALSYLYENALITKETRAELGTHSTPVYLVDYILGRLRPWIQNILPHERRVFEPACGHAAFLVAALRLLGELYPGPSTLSDRHKYFQQRIVGSDIDPFALEIARLSLTLADVPNPNGWQLIPGDVFSDNTIEKHAASASIILANPPFADFSGQDRSEYTSAGHRPKRQNKAAEVLHRVVHAVPAGGVIGFVLPQGILTSKDSTNLRRYIDEQFDLEEITLFPDRIFAFSDAETAVILGKKKDKLSQGRSVVVYRRIRERDVEKFRNTFAATTEVRVPQARFSNTDSTSFWVPDLESVWEACATLPLLKDAALIGKGFEFRGEKDPRRPSNMLTHSLSRRDGMVEGYLRFSREAYTHQTPPTVWLNLRPDVLRREGRGMATGQPRLLVNYAPVSRDPWRLKAIIDDRGRPASSRFLVIQPQASSQWSVGALWALLNSPFANAFVYTHAGKRDMPPRLLRSMPVPDVGADAVADIEALVAQYLSLARTYKDQSLSSDELMQLHWQIDAEILHLYGLEPKVEAQILKLFTGVARGGVPFVQTSFLPREFNDPITLRELLKAVHQWQATNAVRGDLIKRSVRGKLTADERKDLDELQRIADLRVALVAPLPLARLEAVQLQLQQKLSWEMD
jgi:hypothetical protein